MSEWEDKTPDENQNIIFFLNGVKTLWLLTKTERSRLIQVTYWTILLVVLDLSCSYLLKKVFDNLEQIARGNVVQTGFIALFSFWYITKIITYALDRFVKEPKFITLIINLENYWPIKAQKKLLELSLGFHEKENTGKKIAKINKGCDKLVNILYNMHQNFFLQIVYMIFNVIAIVVFIDFWIGIIFFLPIIPAIFINIRATKKFGPAWEKWNIKKELAVGKLCESIIHVQTVQNFTQESRELENHGVIRSEMKTLDLNASIGIQKYIFAISVFLFTFYFITVGVGTWFILNGKTSFGSVLFVLTTGNATIHCIWSVMNSYVNMLRDMYAVVRMKELFDIEPDIKNSPDAFIPEKFNGEIRFNNVFFTYDGKEKSILNGLSLSINPKEMIAFVGKSGEGKSTLFRLISRMFDVNDGSITLDDNNIKDLDLYWYRKMFAIVLQEVDIFDGSILENIRYANINADEDDVLEAARAAHLSIVIEDRRRFPNGINTQVGENGVKLSGGEKQRVGIARAYIALKYGAKILMLDEATSHLDSEAELAIQDMIEKLRQEKNFSIIVIAHRLSTINKSDMIYVINDGRIEEKGNHLNLLKKNGLYRKLVELQNLGEIDTPTNKIYEAPKITKLAAEISVN